MAGRRVKKWPVILSGRKREGMQPQGPQDGHLVVADHRPANGGFMIYVHMAGLITGFPKQSN